MLYFLNVKESVNSGFIYKKKDALVFQLFNVQNSDLGPKNHLKLDALSDLLKQDEDLKRAPVQCITGTKRC